MTSSLKSLDLEAHLGDIGAGLEIIAFRRLGDADDARDAVQETLARLLTRVREGRVCDRGELERVAYGILRHVIVDALRARGRHVSLESTPLVIQADVLHALIAGEERARFRAALETLSDSDRALLERCFVHGERIGQIAADLGEPADRLRKRKSRALSRLIDAVHGVIGLSRNEPPTDE